ncbi:MAG: KUP/HAK/KT family potassium transporter [Cyanobacteria bacterium SZAS TMP-1]|nr:KUP/HAK/KT family potassium transporter [Cyanobacteria bacterium SZAS TMP-1]
MSAPVSLEANAAATPSHRSLSNFSLTLIALGVVYGDIGTSPLYAMQVTLQALGHSNPGAADAMGIASLICWSLLITIGIKYALIVLKADNNGEGGILALATLTNPHRRKSQRSSLTAITIFGIIGSALLFGDGAITPAISVLSAMEGMKVLAPEFEQAVIPATIALLVLLFTVQRLGTGKIGGAFGPVMLLWFATIAAIGVYRIWQVPSVLLAINPLYAYQTLSDNATVAGAIFGAVFLAITGGEAMYADMGHVGATAIRRALAFIVLPSLMLSYFGQAALIMQDSSAMESLFYKAAPAWSLVPMIFLAAAATIIASQALISGVFSLASQSIHLDLLPKMRVSQTSHHEKGQIYVPMINFFLAVGTIVIVLAFRRSDALAAAYGVAVSGTMLITTLLISRVMVLKWRWSRLLTALTILVFGTIDLGFFMANSAKIAEGGWLPISIGVVISFLMMSWRLGTIAVRKEAAKLAVPVETFMETVRDSNITRVPGLAVWMTKITRGISPVMVRHLEHNKSLHEHVVLFSVRIACVPFVTGAERLELEELGDGFYRMIFHVGFMQTPRVFGAIGAEFKSLADAGRVPHGLEHDLHIFISHETLQRKLNGPALNWMSWTAFIFMKKLSARTTDFFKLPRDKVEERGLYLEV